MGEAVTTMEVDGVTLAKLDFANLDEERYLKAIESAKAFFLARPKGEHIPVIIDASNTYITGKIKAALQSLKNVTDEYTRGTTMKDIHAAIGISGMKKVIASLIDRDGRFFDTLDDAVRWAVSEAKKR